MAMERTAMGSSEYTRMLSREGVGGGGSYMTARKEQGKQGKGPFRHATALLHGQMQPNPILPSTPKLTMLSGTSRHIQQFSYSSAIYSFPYGYY